MCFWDPVIDNYFLFLAALLGELALVDGPLPGAGGAVPRRFPDSPPVAVPPPRSVGGVRWRDWESSQPTSRVEEQLHATNHPPPVVNGGQRFQRAASQDPADIGFWQRNVVRTKTTLLTLFFIIIVLLNQESCSNSETSANLNRNADPQSTNC